MNRKPEAENLHQVNVTFRVEYADTDAQGRVYYGNFMRFFDRARCAYWEAIGCDAAWVRRCEDETVLVKMRANYKAPVRLWDLLTVRCRITRLGRSSIGAVYRATAAPDNRLIAEGFETIVWIDPATNKSVPIPQDIRRRIEAFAGPRLYRPGAGTPER